MWVTFCFGCVEDVAAAIDNRCGAGVLAVRPLKPGEFDGVHDVDQLAGASDTRVTMSRLAAASGAEVIHVTPLFADGVRKVSGRVKACGPVSYLETQIAQECLRF